MPKYQRILKPKAVRHGLIAPERQEPTTQQQELGLAKKEYIVCQDCSAAYFDKSWHRGLEEDVKHFEEKNKMIKFKICPACQMRRDKKYEGEIVLKFPVSSFRFPKEEILNLLKNSNQQAQEKDPMDRVLWTEEKDDGLHVYTSENQLAVKIGKKLKSAYKDSKLEIKHSHAEDPIRVYWEYKR